MFQVFPLQFSIKKYFAKIFQALFSYQALSEFFLFLFISLKMIWWLWATLQTHSRNVERFDIEHLYSVEKRYFCERSA